MKTHKQTPDMKSKSQQAFKEYVKKNYPGWESLPDESMFKDHIEDAFIAGCDYILSEMEKRNA